MSKSSYTCLGDYKVRNYFPRNLMCISLLLSAVSALTITTSEATERAADSMHALRMNAYIDDDYSDISRLGQAEYIVLESRSVLSRMLDWAKSDGTSEYEWEMRGHYTTAVLGARTVIKAGTKADLSVERIRRSNIELSIFMAAHSLAEARSTAESIASRVQGALETALAEFADSEAVKAALAADAARVAVDTVLKAIKEGGASIEKIRQRIQGKINKAINGRDEAIRLAGYLAQKFVINTASKGTGYAPTNDTSFEVEKIHRSRVNAESMAADVRENTAEILAEIELSKFVVPDIAGIVGQYLDKPDLDS